MLCSFSNDFLDMKIKVLRIDQAISIKLKIFNRFKNHNIEKDSLKNLCEVLSQSQSQPSITIIFFFTIVTHCDTRFLISDY